ncbi:MAG: FG-GAP repeat protein [Anaerolineae bacterium]
MEDETVTNLAWGDVDGDGFLDLAAGAAESCGRDGQGNLVCRDGVARVLPNISQSPDGTPTGSSPVRSLSAQDVWRTPTAQDTERVGLGRRGQRRRSGPAGGRPPAAAPSLRQRRRRAAAVSRSGSLSRRPRRAAWPGATTTATATWTWPSPTRTRRCIFTATMAGG